MGYGALIAGGGALTLTLLTLLAYFLYERFTAPVAERQALNSQSFFYSASGISPTSAPGSGQQPAEYAPHNNY